MCQSCGSVRSGFIRANLAGLIASPNVVSAAKEWVWANFPSYHLMPLTFQNLTPSGVLELVHHYYPGGVPAFVVELPTPGNEEQAAGSVDMGHDFDMGGEG